MKDEYKCADIIEGVSFPLPFTPYEAQREFIRRAYECFERSNFGLFEAPTGSGKTISILYSALVWLYKNRVKHEIEARQSSEPHDDSIPDWVRASAEDTRKRDAEFLFESQNKYLAHLRSKYAHAYEVTANGTRIRDSFKRHFNSESKRNLKGNSDEAQPDDVTVPPAHADAVQVIICSRTFTQLNQYVDEFRRLGYLSRNFKIAIAAGRFQVCVNENVKAKCTCNEQLNEECHSIKCNFRADVTDLKEASMCYPMDIEELVAAAKVVSSCPYYATLDNVQHADVVLAPYVSIINESLRNNLKIRIQGNILVFDEAHNLTNAITACTSSSVTSTQMKALFEQIKSYINKYKEIPDVDRIELFEVAKVAEILSSEGLARFKNGKGDEPKVSTVSSFLVQFELEDVRFHQILDFLINGGYSRKICAWAKRLANIKDDVKGQLHTSNVNVIYAFRDFTTAILATLVSDSVIISSNGSEIVYEIYSVAGGLFNGSYHIYMQRKAFIKWVGRQGFNLLILASLAKSVLLTSGTLSPIEEFMRLVPLDATPLLYRGKAPFPISRLYSVILSKDANGNALTFDYQSRSRTDVLEYLCLVIESLCALVPNGMVVFFSSYAFMESFRVNFKKCGAHVRCMTKKRLYFETQGKGLETFQQYSKDALDGGALLFAIFGGSLCEGVNFTDGLSRLLLLVGQPYPPESVKLQLKQEYMQKKANDPVTSERERQVALKLAKEYKSLVCYKMINQTIGRAMRHKNDYAALVMFDARYLQKIPMLSTTIQESLQLYKSSNATLDEIIKSLPNFYKLMGV